MGVTDKALQQLLKLAIEVKTLWTNASPLSSFNEQDISLNISNYSHLAVLAILSSKSYTQKTFVVKNKNGGLIDFAYGNGSSVANYYRTFSFGENKITFNQGWLSTVSADSRNNEAAVPIVIYGLKILGGGYKLTRKIKDLFSRLGGRCVSCQC